MRSGKLDRTIKLQHFTTTVNEYGTQQETWADYATVRAELMEESTQEFRANYGDRNEALTIWRIRHRDDVTTEHRVSYDGEFFEVREIAKMGRRKSLELRCVEVRP
ncbi:MAG: phage head closure protein [Pseudomonadota bacterium]